MKLYATKTSCSKEAIQCLEQYFAYYSRPQVLVSDRGAAFTFHEFEEFVKNNQIKHVKIATGAPRANGQAERYNRVLTPMLAKISENSPGKHWYQVLEQAEYALNNTSNKTTNDTPSRLLFGVIQRGK